MKILLIYATNSGSTYVASQIINNVLTKKHRVTVKKAVDVDQHELSNYDLIILGTPSWDIEGVQGSPHETVLKLMDKLKTIDLANKKFAIFGCGDSSFTYFCGAVDKLEEWVGKKGGVRVIPSLKIDGFFFDLKTNNPKVEQWAKSFNL